MLVEALLMRLPGLLRFKGIKINLISEQHVRSVSYRIGFSCLENQTFTLTLNKCIIKATLIFVWYIDLEKKPLNVLIMLAVSDSYVVQWLRSILNYLPDFHALFVFTTFLRNIKIPKCNVLSNKFEISRKNAEALKKYATSVLISIRCVHRMCSVYLVLLS